MKQALYLAIAITIVAVTALIVITTLTKLHRDYWSALNWGSLPVTNTINDPNNSK